MRKRFLLFVASLFLLPSCFLKAQFQAVEVKPSAKVEVVNGDYFFLHPVLPGHTLYSISRAYDVTQEMIIDQNPELEYGLKSDQVIKIPAFAHLVVAGDTEYNLSRRYGLTIDQLRGFNPTLSDGLKLGQQLLLPGRLPDLSDHEEDKDDERSRERARLPVWPTERAPQPIDSEYPLDADSVRDSLQHDSTIRTLYGAIIPCLQASPKETYHVALLIPLFLDDLPPSIHSDSLHAGIIEGLSLRHRSFSFLPYYQGVLIALDSIQKQGVDIQLHVFDVDQNELKARQAVSSPGFSSMDLIIGPFYSNTLDYVSNYALHNNINVVSPLLPDRQKLRGSPKLFNAIPSLDIQLNYLSGYIGKNYPESNIVIVHNNQPQALPVINSFKRSLSASLVNQKNSQPRLIQTDWRNEGADKPMDDDTVKDGYQGFNEVVYDRVGISGLLSKLAENKDNIIITLISGEAFLSNYLRELSIHSGEYAMEVFGIPDWKDYESIEIDYLQNLHVHIFSPYFIDYSEQHIKDFIRRYRQEFKTEPSSDAYMAVSTAYYFFSALAIYGSSFPDCMEQLNKLPIDFPFHFQRPYGVDNGWENGFTTLFKYKDFRLVDVRKELP